MNTIRFFVAGDPQTAGSKKTFVMKIKDRPGTSPKDYRAIVTDNNPNGENWKRSAVVCARQVYQGPPLDGPLQMDVTFTIERPQSHFGTGKNEGTIKASAPEHHVTRPDCTKLMRCIEDGLTGVIYHDDGQIVLQIIRKEYGPKSGALVEIGPLVETLF